MRYTRYNYKKKNNNLLKLLIIIMVFLVVAFVASKGLEGVLKRELTGKEKEETQEVDGKKSTESNSGLTFWIIQGGFYSKKENAEAVNNQLRSKYNSFIVEDGDKFRVIIDIIRKDQGDIFIKSLTEQGISFVKSEINIDYKDSASEQLGNSIDALMQHHERLKENDVASINTAELKKWSGEIKLPEGENPHKEDLAAINVFIQGLPEDLTKASQEDLSRFIYNMVVKYKI
ncbi:hypothetical protein ACPWSR_14490 [Alloiococcus sp. CFN-8]|uniref:hypothetical protein n=1 Tax=Alloiococcus sp. CFN-8 TaxID=3416081 RepID=UPI003CEB04D2